VEKLEKALAGNSNIDRFSTYVGSGAIRFYLPMDVLLENENIAQMVVVAKDLAARDRLHAQLNRILATQFSDIITRVSPLELGPPVGWPIKYRVSGPDYLQVRALRTVSRTRLAAPRSHATLTRRPESRRGSSPLR
jgi:multidrug efflux pump subunit AcrB